jgi:spore germination protein YaaH
MPRLNCQNVADEEQILNDPSVREQTIERLAALCQTYGYAGVQIDFEGASPAERNPFTAFITALAERLHAQGDKLSTVVTAKYYNVPTGRAAMYDDAALSGPSDYMFVLDWGIHWTTSTPGSIDELPWFKRVAEYTATLPNREKFVLGMPLYGLDWPEGGGPNHPATAMEYDSLTELAGQLSVTPEWEANAASPHFSYSEGGVEHQVWYVDRQSLAIRAALVESLGLKVGLWRLGTEDQSIWALPQLGGSE